MSVPKLFIWENRSLYLGAVFIQLKKYTITSDQLIIATKGSIRIQEPGQEALECRSILLRAGSQVNMDISDARDAIISIAYLNPLGQDFTSLQQSMGLEIQGAYFHHRNEQRIIDTLVHIRDSNLSISDAEQNFLELLAPEDPSNFIAKEFDPRIITVVERLNELVRENVSIKSLADEVHLSESRLVKLFKQQIGLPITRYRLRHRIFISVLHLAVGKSVTEAALAAGFASTAHFSKCFTATMGIQPSASFLKPPFVDISIDEKVLANMD